MTQMKDSISTTIARARVRTDVASYFRQLGGHGQMNFEEIADGEMDYVDHTEAILNAAEKRGLDLAACHDLDTAALREALEHECAEIIAWAVSELELPKR